jgi:phosphoadenosine phosphosulfate reductase
MKIKTEAQELAAIERAMRGAEKVTGVYEAEDLVRYACERHGEKAVVSWSGGRCSTAALFMALKINPKIKVIFNDTGVLYPETVKFVEETAKKYGINLIIARPTTTFWAVCKEHGYPFEVRAGRGEPPCCRYLKWQPTKRKLKEIGAEAEITGIRVGEARHRMFGVEQRGQFYFTKKWGIWKYHPIAFWTTKELIAHNEKNSLPEDPIYKKYNLDRNGCWPCSGYIGWKENMARIRPKFYAWMMKQMGPQRILDHYYRTAVAPCNERS